VRLASPDNDTLEWLVGVYYTHETGELFQRFLPFDIATEQLIPQALTLGGVTIPEFVIVTLDSSYEEIAGFASATWHVTPRFDITAGGRYSHNSQDSEQLILQLGSGGTILGDSSQGVFTWSVAPRFEINDRVSIYARAAKGYRPGGPNAVPPNAPPNFPAQFRADTLVSYELGVRGQTADGTLGIDAAVFHIDWDDILINTVVFDANGTPFGANGNGRRARSTGAEITATLRPMRGLNAILNLAYTDAKLRDDTTPDDNSLNLTGGLAGDPLPYIPKLAANLSVDYDWRVLGDARAYVGANLHVVDDEPAGFAATYRAVFGRRLTLDGYETVDLRAGVDFGRFNVNAYIRNLTNSRGLVNAGFPQAIPADIGGTGRQLATVSSIRPRTIGMTVGVEF
jgi:iron complex outermembrane recepter protein